MKSRNKINCILLALFSVPILFAQSQQPLKPVRLEKLCDSLYQTLDGRGAQGGVFIGHDAVLLIDSKMDSASVNQVLDELKKMTDKPVRFVVHTHADGDHVRGDRYQPPAAVFVAHENCRKEMLLPGRDGKPSEWESPELMRFLPSVTFRDRMNLYLGAKKIELWYFGVGHTTGDAVVYFPDRKIAFIGDMVFLSRVPLIHAYKGGNSLELVKTLSKMITSLDAEWFYSGHSEKIDRQGLRNYIERMTQRQAKIKVGILSGKSLDTIKAEFTNDEAALTEIIYNEIKSKSPATP